MISRLFGLVLAVAVAMIPSLASGVEPKRPGQESFLHRAVFAGGRLWLLSDAGDLSSIAEGKDTRLPESLPEPGLDLCSQDGHAVVVTCKREDCRNWTVRRWADGTWSVVTTVQSGRDQLIALSCGVEALTLVTTRRLIEDGSGNQTTVELSEPLQGGMVASVQETSDPVFVGINAGEWGGGLRRIDRRSGKVTAIERNETGELCGGPLNTACDPVNGIASEPWKPKCIAVAVGLVHFEPHGRIVEICGDKVQRIYYKQYGENPPGRPSKGNEPFRTVAFFGLARAKGALWAVGIDGMYRIEGDGTVQFTELPTFKNVGGLRVSFGLPDLVLVYTSINQRRSISGSVPMLIPR